MGNDKSFPGSRMLKVGIIGTGAIAHEHARAIALVGESVSLVAAADQLQQRLIDFANSYTIPSRYMSAAALISDPEVDLVVVATPPSAHEEATVAALDNGKYVLCEKPLAHSLASAEAIAAAEARHPGRLSVSHQLRYDPRYRRMLWLVKNGWIGDVREARVERHGYIWKSTHTAGHGWWGNWAVAGGGVLMTQMIHEMDILLLAMGRPNMVSSRMDTRYTDIQSEDWVEGEVIFEGARKAHFSASVNSGQMRGGFIIRGSLGSVTPEGLELDDQASQVRALTAVYSAMPETRPVPVTASLPARAARKLLRAFSFGERRALTPHAMLYRDIAAAVAAGQPLPIPAGEAMRPMQLVAGVYEAAITGRQVDLSIGPITEVHGGVSPTAYAGRNQSEPEMPPVVKLPMSNVVRVGIIGLDTTHAPTFTQLLHDPYASDHIPGAKVVAAFPGGSLDMEISASRVGTFTAELRDRFHVPILDSPEAVADAADVVFILSSDGRAHPGLFRSVAGRGRPVFIDKPFAISVADARRIYDLAEKLKTKVFASSAFRYADGLVNALNEIRASGEAVKGCTVRYWGQVQPTQGRYFWYGIHGAEMLMAVMGKGVRSATAHTDGTRDLIEVEHRDGRRSRMIGDHHDGNFHVTIETDRRTLEIPADGPIAPRILAAALDVLTPGGYPRLWRASEAGSVSGRPGKLLDPDAAETMEVISLLEAAELSHAGGGKPIEVRV